MPVTTSVWNVQKAVYNALINNSDLTGLLAAGAGSIFDTAPRQSAFPYVLIGPMTAEPMDTQRTAMLDVMITIDSYAREQGMKQIKNIMSALSAALHNVVITVDDHVVVLCQEKNMAVFVEEDSETRRGTQKFRIIVEKV